VRSPDRPTRLPISMFARSNVRKRLRAAFHACRGTIPAETWASEQPAKCYLSGPMTGLAYFNFRAFEIVAKQLRDVGWFVYSPRENDGEAGIEPNPEGKLGEGGPEYKDLMKRDLWQVCDSDAVFVMPGWEYSEGAKLEVYVAHQVNVPVYTFPGVREIEAPEHVPHEFSSRWTGEKTATGESLLPETAEEWLREALTRGWGLASEPPFPDFGPSWRDTSAEGTSKGRREAIFANIPVHALVQLARVHGNSVVPKDGEPAKYADVEPGVPNWSKGCPWSWMLDALWRHLLAWQAGVDEDPESGLSNLAHVLWMACTLMEYQRLARGTDDRLRA